MGTIGYKITFRTEEATTGEKTSFDIYTDNADHDNSISEIKGLKNCGAYIESIDYENKIYQHCHIKAVIIIKEKPSTSGDTTSSVDTNSDAETKAVEYPPATNVLNELFKKYKYVDFAITEDGTKFTPSETNLEVFDIKAKYSLKTEAKNIQLIIDIYSPDKKLEQREFNMVYTGRKLGEEIFLGTKVLDNSELEKTTECLKNIRDGINDNDKISGALKELENETAGYSNIIDSINRMTKYNNCLKQALEITTKLNKFNDFLNELSAIADNDDKKNIEKVINTINEWLDKDITKDLDESLYKFKSQLDQIRKKSNYNLTEDDKKTINEIINYKVEYKGTEIKTTISGFSYDKSYMKQYIEERDGKTNHEKDKEAIESIKDTLENYQKKGCKIDTIKDIAGQTKDNNNKDVINIMDDAISTLNGIKEINYINYKEYNDIKTLIEKIQSDNKKLSEKYIKNEAKGYIEKLSTGKKNKIPTVQGMIKDFGIKNLKLEEALVNLKYGTDKKELIQPYLVQLDETFYDFLCRVANRCGELVYYNNGYLCLGRKEINKSATKIDCKNDDSLEHLYYEAAPKQVGNIRSFDDNKLFPRDISDYKDSYLQIFKKEDLGFWSSIWGGVEELPEYLKILASATSLADFMTKVAEDLIMDRMWKQGISTTASNEKMDENFNKWKSKTYDEQRSNDKEIVYFGTHKNYIDDKGLFDIKEINNLNSKYFEYVRKAQDSWSLESLVLEYNSSKYHKFSIGEEIYIDIDNDKKIYVVVGVERFFKSQRAKDDESGNETALKITAIPYFYQTGNSKILIPHAIEKKEIKKKYTTGIGRITDTSDPSKIGRVRFVYEWQEKDDNTNYYGDESPWVRILQPFASKDTAGFKFDPQKGDMALIEYENNDYERPFISGFMFEENSKADTRDFTNTVQLNNDEVMPTRGITSANGHQIIFDDAKVSKFFDSFIPLFSTWKSLTGLEGEWHKNMDSNSKLAGGITLTDQLGFYTISASTHKRKITISSPLGNVDINAFTGIKISAPNGNIKIVGKNVSIEAGNKVSIKSGTNIEQVFKGAKDEWRENLLDTAKDNFLQFIKVADISVIRNIFEVFMRPIGGSTTINSFTDITLTAGRGSTYDPKKGFIGDAGNYIKLKKLISDHMAKFPAYKYENDKFTIEDKKMNIKNLLDNLQKAIEVKLEIKVNQAEDLKNNIKNEILKNVKVTVNTDNSCTLQYTPVVVENIVNWDQNSKYSKEMKTDGSWGDGDYRKITAVAFNNTRLNKLESAKDEINTKISEFATTIINGFNNCKIYWDGVNKNDDFKDAVKKALNDAIEKEEEMNLTGLTDSIRKFERAKILYEFITTNSEVQDLCTKSANGIPFTIEKAHGDEFNVDDIVDADQSFMLSWTKNLVGGEVSRNNILGSVFDTVLNLDVMDTIEYISEWSPWNKRRWRPTGNITLSTNAAQVFKFKDDDTGTFAKKQKKNIAADEMIKDFKTFLVQQALGTKTNPSIITKYALLKIK